MSFSRVSGWLCFAGCLTALAGCGGSQHAGTSPSQPVSRARSAAPNPNKSRGFHPTQAATSASPSSSAPTQTAAAVVGAAGAYLHAPEPTAAQQPATIPANDDCHKLVSRSSQSVITCATATSPRGTITAVLVGEAHSEQVNVYLRQGSVAKLVLTGLRQSSLGYQVRIGSVDPSHDGYNKIAVVESVTQNVNALSKTPLVAGYELVDPPGLVSLHRDLKGGAVTTTSQGLFDYVNAGANSVIASQIVYAKNAWRITYQQRDAALPRLKDPDLLVPSCGTPFC